MIPTPLRQQSPTGIAITITSPSSVRSFVHWPNIRDSGQPTQAITRIGQICRRYCQEVGVQPSVVNGRPANPQLQIKDQVLTSTCKEAARFELRKSRSTKDLRGQVEEFRLIKVES